MDVPTVVRRVRRVQGAHLVLTQAAPCGVLSLVLTRLLILLALLSFVAYSVWVLLGRGRRPAKPQRDPLARAATHTAVWRGAGALLGALLALRLAYAPGSWLGLGVALAAPAFALCILAGVLAGEASVRAWQGTVRQATLGVRGVRAYLPPWPTRLVVLLTVLLVVLLVAAGMAASPDDLGRSLTIARRDGSASTGPWPGVFYGGPLAAAVILGYAAAAVVLRWIARRPRAHSASVELDETLRARSSEVAIAAVGLLVATSLTGAALYAGRAMIAVGGAPGWVRALGALTLLVAVGAFLAGVWCLGLLLLPRSAMPARLVPRRAKPVPGRAAGGSAAGATAAGGSSTGGPAAGGPVVPGQVVTRREGTGR